MRTAAATFIVIGLAATAGLDAQGRGRRAQGIPPGHLPPAGQCRVWYDNLPPGRQPAPTNCDRAEQLASRDRDARVIYGDRSTRADETWRTNDDYRTGGGFEEWSVLTVVPAPGSLAMLALAAALGQRRKRA